MLFLRVCLKTVNMPRQRVFSRCLGTIFLYMAIAAGRFFRGPTKRFQSVLLNGRRLSSALQSIKYITGISWYTPQWR